MKGSSLRQQGGTPRLCRRRRILKAGLSNQQFRASAMAQTVAPPNARASEPSRSLWLWLGICSVYFVTVLSVATYYAFQTFGVVVSSSHVSETVVMPVLAAGTAIGERGSSPVGATATTSLISPPVRVGAD
jgi:hypothetical protein